jgi:3-dehydroquinate synthase
MIFLYGPPGSGKTTVGQRLAAHLNLSLWDLDDEIEGLDGRGIPQIFAADGEAGFRERERATLQKILARGEGIIALGGGALLSSENRALVEKAGPVLCLTAPFEILLARLQTAETPRPLLAGNASVRLQELLEQRAAHYASFPLHFDSGSLAPEQIAWEMQLALGVFHVRGMGEGYDVRVTPAGLKTVGEALEVRGLLDSLALISDKNVGERYAPRVLESLEKVGYRPRSIFLPVGEAYKTIQTVQQVWEAFVNGEIERDSTVLALGGGVVGDLAGFAAATFGRGVRWVVLPTTLLAMVDASLGGKTGIDLPQGKNLVGAFHPPSLVLADSDCLATLPKAELLSGLAEVVKHGVIGDAALFGACAQGWAALQADWAAVVRRGMGVKVRIIQADPFEKGLRAVLNFGHTIGHAVERLSEYRLRHGEAVAIGMVAETRLAERLGLAEAGLTERLAGVLRGLGLPTEIPSPMSRTAILQVMQLDKKRRAGRLRFALPKSIGEVEVVPVDEAVILE